MLFMKRIGFGFAIALFTFLSGTSAWGHAELVLSTPVQGSVVKDFPENISLTFDEELIVLGEEKVNTLQLVNSDGVELMLANLEVDGDSISAAISSVENQRIPGDYIVKYRVVSADGHPVEGEILFAFQPQSAPEANSPSPISVAPQDDSVNIGFNSLIVGVFIAFLVITCALLLVRKRK